MFRSVTVSSSHVSIYHRNGLQFPRFYLFIIQKSGRKGKAGGKGGKKDDTKKNDPVSLDKAMDAYWFKAGKGPDPEQAALDRQMDTYFQSKPAAAAATEAEEGNNAM